MDMRKKTLARGFLRALLIGSLFWAGPLCSPAAAAPLAPPEPPVVELAENAQYRLDPTDTLGYAEVLAGTVPFARHSGPSFQFSFRRGTLWIKCRLSDPPRRETGPSRQSLLVFDNISLGSLTLYVPVLKGGLPETLILRGGWQNAAASQEIRFLYPLFTLPENLDATRPLIIRVATPFALQFRVTQYTIATYRDTSFTLFLIVGFCSGILVAMLLYNLVLYFFVHDRQYLYYLLYVLFLLLWQGILFGLVRYFWPALGEWMIAHIIVFAVLMMVFAIVFAISFLETARTAPRHDRFLKGLVAVAMLILALTLAGHHWIANTASYLLGQVGTVALFSAAVTALRSGFRPARYYLIALAFLLTASCVFLFKYYGLLPNNTVTMHALLFGSAAEAILLSFALGYRIRLLQDEGRSLRERERSLREMTVTDELTGLFNRRFFSATLEKNVTEAARSGKPLTLLVMDVDHFKGFNDAHGHAEGDEVLREIGHVILRNLREGDIACRYGGEEFVAILHQADLDVAVEVAERVRTRFEAALAQRWPDIVPLTVSIGVCTWQRGETAEDLFKRCDRALYRAKEAGRNRVWRA